MLLTWTWLKSVWTWLKSRGAELAIFIGTVLTLGALANHYRKKANREAARADSEAGARADLEERVIAREEADRQHAIVEADRARRDREAEARREEADDVAEAAHDRVDDAVSSGTLADELNKAIEAGEL